MQDTPNGFRTNVGIFGETNAGKSALFNAITKTDIAIVSEIKGTTTDPIRKPMELIPFGPIVLIDTAGFGDDSELGQQRINKTKKSISEIDFAIYVSDISNFNDSEYSQFLDEISLKNVKHMLVFTKIDVCESETITKINKEYPYSVLVNTFDESSVENLRKILVERLSQVRKHDESFLMDILKPKSKVVLICPIDSEAPKGRLILPQAQIIRDCLDNDILCSICTFNTLDETLKMHENIDLVITDSQLFREVEQVIPKKMPLTSFSILIAKQKVGFKAFVDGTKKIAELKDGAKILIAEACTHNISHEDIGRVKIPKLLKNKIGENITIDFTVGKDFPDNVNEYDLIVHCGGCMINGKEMYNRVDLALKNDIPIANYGTVIAYCNGILERAIEPLSTKKQV